MHPILVVNGLQSQYEVGVGVGGQSSLCLKAFASLTLPEHLQAGKPYSDTLGKDALAEIF